ncbi:MAG: rhamnulokinase family protein [Candidatus Odinarchaeota archaeon]
MEDADTSHFLAVDLGADSGRVILGTLSSSKLSLETVSRFPTKGTYMFNTLRWNVVRFWEEIKKGLSIVAGKKKINLKGIGVDSWGVNLVYLTGDRELAAIPFHYRDDLINTGDERMRVTLDMDRVFSITGIQELKVNGLVHLFGVKKLYPGVLKRTRSIIMIPDYFNYLLTGRLATEYTNATTTQFFDAKQKKFSEELLKPLDIETSVFPEMLEPGTLIGPLHREVQLETGLGPVNVYTVASHDTGSAIVGVPAEGDNWAYLSSGTWSLLGIELKTPIITIRARKFNFTNEGGAFGTIRLLKNVMGLWLLQKCKEIWEKESNKMFSYQELSGEAEKETTDAIIDIDAPEFLNPRNMVEAIEQHCRENGQKTPETRGQIVRCIYQSLARKYQEVISQLEEVTGKKIERLYIVGGGSQDDLLNQIIAGTLKIEVCIGPVEATAAGNIMLQAYATGVVSGLSEIREIIRNSFTRYDH